MNGLRAGMSAPPLDGCRSGGGRSHVSDVPRAYVYRGLSRTAAVVKGFGCRPGTSGRPGKEPASESLERSTR